MTRLEELVSRGPVEWRTLGEVGNVATGERQELTRRYSDTGTIIALRALNVKGRLDLSQVKYIDGSNLEKLSRSKLRRNDLLLTRVGCNTGQVALVDCDDRYYMGSNLFRIRFTEGVDPRFALHYFQTEGFRTLNFRHHVRKSTMENLNAGGVRCFMIPLPPLAVQREIADVLDTFSERERELEELLTAELAARRKQYRYYQDQLLKFGEGEAEWTTFGEIGQVVLGNRLEKRDFTESGVGCVHYGQIYTRYGLFADRTFTFVSEEDAPRFKKASTGDLIITTTSENLRDVCKALVWEGEETICVSANTAILKHDQNPRYLGYYTQTSMFAQEKYRRTIGTMLMVVSVEKLRQFPVPIPPRHVQDEIVRILDQLYSQSQRLMEGLQAELEARRKQYAYYRERLLSFPRPGGIQKGGDTSDR